MIPTTEPDHAERLLRDTRAGELRCDAAWFLPFKTTSDVVIAVLLLALTSPLLLFLLILVKVTSRGPAIYKQVRLGRDGRPFEVFKIRTMAHDCERLTGPQWSTGKDPRVTPLGRFLRRSHLDELPQLWNVIRGEMNLVGPRPERPEFVVRLEVALPGYGARMAVTPGITGLAQVQLPPDETLDDVARKLACDLCYIRRLGPWLDLKILVATAMKVAGFPFGTTRRLLALPGWDEVGSPPESSVGPMAQLRSI